MPTRRAKSKAVRIVDVARESGFSPSTVSIVLNDAPLSRYVAASTKEQIRKTAEKLGYFPDIFARSLRSRRTHTIGVLIFDISDPFCMLILRGIEKALHPTPYLPLIMDAQNEWSQFEGYLRMLMERRVEGLIVVANWLFEARGLLAEVRNRNLPMVVVGRDLSHESFRSVVVQNEHGGYMAAQHLHDLGHRNIAVIRGPAKLTDSLRRWEGIQRFATECGTDLHFCDTRQMPGSLDSSSGFDEGAAMTAELLRDSSGFTALIAFDDMTALGAVRALSTTGVRVPEDCSVIGFDDIPAVSLSTPGITTIRQPMEKMGALAVERVLAMLSDGENSVAAHPLLEMLEPALVLRGSTQLLSKSRSATSRVSR